MASEGLLGFIGGITETLSKEYDRMNEEDTAIRKEDRDEAADLRAEVRREMAEKRVADYRKQLDFDWATKEEERQRGLIESGTDLEFLRGKKQTEYEADLYRKGAHPDTLQEEASDLSKAARVRGGVDSGTAEYDAEVARAPEKTKLEAEAEAAKTDARNRADEESDKRRRAEGNPKVGTEGSDINVKFSATEADKLLRDNIGLELGASISDIQKRVSAGESALAEVKRGTPISELIEQDETNRELIRQELAAQIYVQAKGELMKAAKGEKINDPSQIQELAGVVSQKADELIELDMQSSANISQWTTAVAQGKKPKGTPQDIMKALESQFAESLGEGDARSPAFRQIWSTFKGQYERQLGLKVK